jgi:hypothetical protein
VVRAVAALVAGGVAAVVLAPTVVLFFPALGLSSGAAPAFVATLLALAFLPAFELLFPVPGEQRLAAAVVPVTAGLLAAGLTVAGLLVDTFDARHPVPSQLVYALDADESRAWWVSTEDDPGDYTGRYVSALGDLPLEFPYLDGEVWTGEADVAALPAPDLTVQATPDGDGRRLQVEIVPQREVRLLALEVVTDGGTVTAAAAEGRDVPADALGSDRLFVTFHAPPDDGVRFTVAVEGEGPVTVRAIDGSDGLGGLPGFEPRPDDVDAAGTHSSDLVLVSRSAAVG